MTRDRLLEQAIELLAIADFHSLTLKEERNQVVREGIELLRQPKQEPVAWLLTDKNINSLQVDDIQRLIDRLKHAHHTDLCVRINGQDEWFEADWLKHMVRVTPPQRTEQEPAGWEVGVVDGVVTRRLAPPQRKPLTHKEIWNAIRPLTQSDAVCMSLVQISMDEYRAIEAAHGIKGDA